MFAQGVISFRRGLMNQEIAEDFKSYLREEVVRGSSGSHKKMVGTKVSQHSFLYLYLPIRKEWLIHTGQEGRRTNFRLHVLANVFAFFVGCAGGVCDQTAQ